MDSAVHLQGWFNSEGGRERRANPEGVRGFNKHAVGADVADVNLKSYRTPLNF